MAARGKNRQFPTAYKLKAIKRVERGEGVLPVARELGISRKILITVTVHKTLAGELSALSPNVVMAIMRNVWMKRQLRLRSTLHQLVTVQGSITVRPAALNARVSRDATANPWAAAIAAI